MARGAGVKTEKLPNTYQAKGNWYFKCSEAHVPLAGEPFDDTFMGHYYTLCRLFNVGFIPDDTRSVYFIGWEGGPIKIGMSGGSKGRRTSLQVACPYELKVWAETTGGTKGELEYHRRFKNWWMRGEWFERCPEIEAEIERLQVQQSLKPVPYLGKGESRWSLTLPPIGETAQSVEGETRRKLTSTRTS